MVAGCMLAATSCSDFSDYNAIDASAHPSADKTLWENIKANANLSDFAQVLEKVGYDKVLNESHTYTVWAPVNDSFDKDSLLSLSDSKIIKEFVKNMVADYAHQETDINDTTVFMLNEKLLKFHGKNTSNMTFDGQPLIANSELSAYNYPSTNGILYTISNPSTFRYNGYEIITDAKDKASKFYDMVMKYQTVTLDEKNSVKGEIVNGLQVYDDSVLIVRNSLIENTLRSKLTNEDSLYTVLIPNDEAWDEAYNRIAKYYNYISEMNYQDLEDKDFPSVKGGGNSAGTAFMALGAGKKLVKLSSKPSDSEFEDNASYWTDSIAKRNITNNLIYSETNTRYNYKLADGQKFEEGDTLYTTTRQKLTNLPELDKATMETKTLSNGHARIINDIPFKSWETYAPEIRTRRVGRYLTSNGSKVSNVIYTNVSKDICTFDKPDETNLYYVRVNVSEGSAYAPEMDFKLPDVLSTTYDIYAVVVPGWIENQDNPNYERKPYTLRFDINYTNEKNEEVRGRFNGEGLVTEAAKVVKVPAFVCGAEKVDTIKLGRVTFPVCYAGTEAYPNIKVYCTLTSFGSANRKKYDQQIRIANIIMKPIDLVEYEEKLKATKED